MKKRGFTLIELLVVIVIIAILAAILFPVFARAKEKAKQTKCIANLKQLALAMRQYMDDNGYLIPPMFLKDDYGISLRSHLCQGPTWTAADLLKGYTGGTEDVWLCDTQKTSCGWNPVNPWTVYPSEPWWRSYQVNGIFHMTNYPHTGGQGLIHERDVPRPQATIWLFEGRGPYGVWVDSADVNGYTGWSIWYVRKPHIGHYNALFVDGHVKALDKVLPRNFNNSKYDDGGVWIAGVYYPEWTGGLASDNPMPDPEGSAPNATPYN